MKSALQVFEEKKREDAKNQAVAEKVQLLTEVEKLQEWVESYAAFLLDDTNVEGKKKVDEILRTIDGKDDYQDITYVGASNRILPGNTMSGNAMIHACHKKTPSVALVKEGHPLHNCVLTAYVKRDVDNFALIGVALLSLGTLCMHDISITMRIHYGKNCVNNLAYDSYKQKKVALEEKERLEKEAHQKKIKEAMIEWLQDYQHLDAHPDSPILELCSYSKDQSVFPHGLFWSDIYQYLRENTMVVSHNQSCSLELRLVYDTNGWVFHSCLGVQVVLVQKQRPSFWSALWNGGG